MKFKHEKSPKTTSSVAPTTLNLQTRPFAPIEAVSTKSPSTEKTEKSEHQQKHSPNILEKLINSSPPELASSVQRKPENRLKAIARNRSIQAKLAIGEPNDKYEKEADDTASKVVQQINTPIQNQSIQRDALPQGNKLRKKPLQRRENVGGGDASTELESSIQRARGSGQSLDANLQRSMGQAMGADFSGVKVHTDSQSDQLNQSIQARAFTTGQDVFFRQGEYNPGSRGGQELLAHELTHVVQQNRTLNTLQSQSLFSPQIQRNGEQKDNEPSGGSLRPALGKELMSNMFGSNWFATGVFKTMNFAMYMEGQKLTQEHHNVLHQSLIENKSGVLTTLINENPHVMKSQGSTPIYLLGKYLVHKPLEYYLEYKNSKKD